MSPKTLLTLLLTILFVAVGILFNARFDGAEDISRVESRETADTPTTAPLEGREIVVYIEGAIAKPGLVYASKDARLGEIINLSGGLLALADADGLNMASLVEDGEKITIPFKKGSDDLNINGAENNLININTASETELQKLPRIGPATAKKIIEYRNQHGAFKKIEDIKNVPRIGEKTFEKLKDLITV